MGTGATEAAGAEQPLSDRVISDVRQRIITQKLRPDETFTEGEIASLLNVSKSPVREALALLRRQGWVQVLARSGYRVAPLTVHDAQNLFTVRHALEPEAAALAAQRGARYPDQVRALQEYARRPSTRSAHGEDAVTEHFRFHRRISVLSGNGELERLVTETLLKLQRYDGLEASAGGRLEFECDHAPLAKAVFERDADGARTLAAAHVAAARDALMSALISSDQLMSASLTMSIPASPSVDRLDLGRDTEVS